MPTYHRALIRAQLNMVQLDTVLLQLSDPAPHPSPDRIAKLIRTRQVQLQTALDDLRAALKGTTDAPDDTDPYEPPA